MKYMKKLLTLLLMLLPVVALAQDDDEMMQVRGNIKFVNQAGERIDPPDRLIYGLLSDRNQANKCESEIKETIFKYQDKEAEREVALEEICKKWQIDKRAPKGTFKTNALPTMVIIVVAPEIGEYVRVNLEKGKTQYKDIPKALKQVQGVDVFGEAQMVPINVSSTDDADDGNERFNIHIEIPPGTARTDSRLLIQAFAVDCQTDDTLGYCGSMVFEGDEYHEKQERRMGYDYRTNDKLAVHYYTNAILREDEWFRLDTTIIWPKPTSLKDHSFRGPYTYAFEDFHHVYEFYDGDGTCLKRRPFKMLAFDAAMSEIELTSEFYEQAESKFEKRNKKINLRFEMGTSTLISDSANIAEQEQLVKELRSYGNSLAQVTIMGAASPDGSLKRNEELANQRVAVAQSILSGKISIKPKKEIKVYTWNDVVQTLRDQQKEDQATAVEVAFNTGGDDNTITKRIKELPFYPLDVEPILESQRSMRCAYMYQAQHVMTPEECVEEFHKNKRDYIDGSRHFSNGDFYNLFDMLTDSLDLDTVTVIAYKEIISEPDYQIENVIAPYVCNRYAVMQMKRGNPNVEILRPFIDLKRYGNGKSGIDVKQWTASRGMIMWNRHEIIANQAAAYYMEQKVDTAMFFVDWLRGNGRTDEGLLQLENLINLKTLHFKPRNAVEERKYQLAKSAVLAMSDENKAILYTEIEDWNMRSMAPYWVSRMPDDNPKKWYLKGLLAALNIKDEPPLIVSPSDDADDNAAGDDKPFYRWSDDKLAEYQADAMFDAAKKAELEKYQKAYLKYKEEHDGEEPPLEPEGEAAETASSNSEPAFDVSKFKDVPQYIGYFQHCFDLDPTKQYFRFYHAEQLVEEALRKKYPYKLKNRPLYRELFKVLQRRDAEMGISEPGEEGADGNSDGAEGEKAGDGGENNGVEGSGDEKKKEEPAA